MRRRATLDDPPAQQLDHLLAFAAGEPRAQQFVRDTGLQTQRVEHQFGRLVDRVVGAVGIAQSVLLEATRTPTDQIRGAREFIDRRATGAGERPDDPLGGVQGLSPRGR